MGRKLPPDEMELYKKIDEILWNDWDPIGVSGAPEARDEYYGYLPTVFRLALEGSGENKITDYLLSVETERMGLPGNKQKCKQIAGLVLRAKTELGL
jgi:hypothetical protein